MIMSLGLALIVGILLINEDILRIPIVENNMDTIGVVIGRTETMTVNFI
jgi:hypothetical protein